VELLGWHDQKPQSPLFAIAPAAPLRPNLKQMFKIHPYVVENQACFGFDRLIGKQQDGACGFEPARQEDRMATAVFGRANRATPPQF